MTKDEVQELLDILHRIDKSLARIEEALVVEETGELDREQEDQREYDPEADHVYGSDSAGLVL